MSKPPRVDLGELGSALASLSIGVAIAEGNPDSKAAWKQAAQLVECAVVELERVAVAIDFLLKAPDGKLPRTSAVWLDDGSKRTLH